MTGSTPSTRDFASLEREFEQLQARVDALEEAGENAVGSLAADFGVSRRQIIAALATAGIGVAGLGAATEEAQAQVDSVGTPSNRVDAFLDSVDAGGVVIDDTYRWASQYDGGDPDARLDNAISAASTGDVIFLEAATYDSARVISGSGNRDLRLVGAGGPVDGTGTNINASWTISTIRVTLEYVCFEVGDSGSLQVDGNDCYINACAGELTVGGDNVRVLNGYTFNGTITFEAGTSGGLVDGYVRTSVTDNGSNTTGDIG